MKRAESPIAKRPANWRSGALVYSGRRDPTWNVPPRTAEDWIRRFETLEHTQNAAPAQARLGYRGVWLLAPDGRRWQAYDGLAWAADDRRRDAGRALERVLLEAAPADALPSGWRLWLAAKE